MQHNYSDEIEDKWDEYEYNSKFELLVEMRGSFPGDYFTRYYNPWERSKYLKELQRVLSVGEADNPESPNAIAKGIPGEYLFTVDDRIYIFTITDTMGVPESEYLKKAFQPGEQMDNETIDYEKYFEDIRYIFKKYLGVIYLIESIDVVKFEKVSQDYNSLIMSKKSLTEEQKENFAILNYLFLIITVNKELQSQLDTFFAKENLEHLEKILTKD